MKIAKVITIAAGTNAFSIPQWFHSNDYEYGLTTTTGDYATEGWTTTASDGEYTPPDITTTTMTSTELSSTTLVPSNDLGPTIVIDVIDCDDDEKSESSIGEIVGDWWTTAWQSLPCYITGC